VKPATMIGVLGTIVAIVLYSIGVWGAYRRKRFSTRDLLFIVGGLVFDVIGTGGMFVTAGNRFLVDTPLNALHTAVAFLAFFGMLAAALVGLWAVRANKDELLANLSRWALAPWTLWAIVFVWGMLAPPKA
jgi:hypothetical protein